MSLKRTLRRTAEKQLAKAAKEKVKEINTKISGFVKRCKVCDQPFDESDKTLLDTWMITVESNHVSLFCPSCFAATQNIERSR